MLVNGCSIQAAAISETANFAQGKRGSDRPRPIKMHDGRPRQKATANPRQTQPKPTALQIVDQDQLCRDIGHLAQQTTCLRLI
jgi:hypothetical protein